MKKIALILPGQGSQYQSMGMDLINSNDEIYKKAEELLDKETFNIIKESKIEDISKTRYAQLAIFLNSLSLFNKLKKDNIEIISMAGLSLGEYSALCASGIIDLEDAINLVNKRGQIMEKGASNKGGMIAVLKSNKELIEKAINKSKEDDVLSICNLNSPDQIVIGGEFEALERFQSIAKNEGIKKLISLNVEGPFHTEILKDSAEEFSKELNKINFKESKFNVYSNVNGLKYTKELDIVDNLKKQMYSTVNFQKCIEKIIDDGCDLFLEIGPGKSLAGFVKKINKNIKTISIQNLDDLNNLEF